MEITLQSHADAAEARSLVPKLDAYIRSALADIRDGEPPPGGGEALLARAFAGPEGVVLSARDPKGGECVGICITTALQDPLTGDDLPALVLLWVDPRWRRRGLARALGERAREELAGRGFQRLAARVESGDDALIAMGERWGFVRVLEWMVREG